MSEELGLLGDLTSIGKRLQHIPWPEHKDLRQMVWEMMCLLRAQIIVMGELDPWPPVPERIAQPRKCTGIRKNDGQPCEAFCLQGTDRCSVHATRKQKETAAKLKSAHRDLCIQWHTSVGCPYPPTIRMLATPPNLGYYIAIAQRTVSPF